MIKEVTAHGKTVQVEIRNENEHIQKYWMRGSFYETQRNGMLNHIANNEKKGGKYIDVGASIGNHSMFFGVVMEAGELHSFEPCWDSYDHLCKNLLLNDMETINHAWQMALGDKHGLCSMEWVSENNVGMKQVRENEGDIQLVKLDSLPFIEGYDVIKIDVEHYNEQLLKGAKETFTKGTGNIYIEAESDQERIRVDNIMQEYGYLRVEGLVFNHTPTYKYVKHV